jgi:hypothetical protein
VKSGVEFSTCGVMLVRSQEVSDFGAFQILDFWAKNDQPVLIFYLKDCFEY